MSRKGVSIEVGRATSNSEDGHYRTMLGKIGRRGNKWAVDASQCQGCTSAFSFFNRKHHCSRCGGIYCGNCTRQRMILHQQGEDPVRVCDPCKKLEDAERFESFYGWSSETSSQMEMDSLLKELIANEVKPETSRRTDCVDSKHVNVPILKDYKCSSMGKEKACSTSTLIKTEGVVKKTEEVIFLAPESLRKQTQKEKKCWNNLKKEGKWEEALQSFKRGMELEQQAETSELSLKHNERKAENSALVRKEKHEEYSGSVKMNKNQSLHLTGKGQQVPGSGIDPINLKEFGRELEEKDDLISALKDLGWGKADLHDAGIKQIKTRNAESELAELAAGKHHEGSNCLGDISSMQVLAHKRRALALKREGKLAEAKEELKKAKNIERQLEEQACDGHESDDDLTALIRSLEEGMPQTSIVNLDMADLVNFVGEDDEDVEVCESEMDDPEMIEALKSMGWEEEAVALEKSIPTGSVRHTELLSKLYEKNRFGSAEGINLQGSAEEVTGILQNVNDNLGAVCVTDEDMMDPYFISAMGFAEKPAKLMQSVAAGIPTPFEKSNLKQEILFLKKEALVLNRARKIQDAKEELRKARNFEKELGDLQFHHIEQETLTASTGWGVFNENKRGTQLHGEDCFFGDEVNLDNIDVTEEEIGELDLVNALKSWGWLDEDRTAGDVKVEKKADKAAPKLAGRSLKVASVSHLSKTRSELQRELLGMKRAALKFIKEGRLEEAEDELKKAYVPEQLIKESGTAAIALKKKVGTAKIGKFAVTENDDDDVTEDDMKDPIMLAALRGFGWNEETEEEDGEMMLKAFLDNTSALHL